MKKILIAPYSSILNNDKTNPKNYPWWQNVIDELSKSYSIYQVGISKENKFNNISGFILDKIFKELCFEIDNCDSWISVDSYFQHIANYRNKKGVVIWSKSDPNIFGYKDNINLVKDRKYLRKFQFDQWHQEDFDEDCFVRPEIVISSIKDIFE